MSHCYRSELSKRELADCDFDELIYRGLSAQAIEAIGFKTLTGTMDVPYTKSVKGKLISVAEFWQKVFPDKDGQSISERTKYLRFQNGKVFPDKDGDNYLPENPGVVIDTISVAEFRWRSFLLCFAFAFAFALLCFC